MGEYENIYLLLTGPGGTPEDTNDRVLDGLRGWVALGGLLG